MKKQLFNPTSVQGRLVLFLTLLSTVSSLTINAQRLVITSDNVTITETSSGSDTQVTVEWDLAGDGNIIYASQFGEPIESGSSVDTLADHTETGIGSNTSVPGITGVSEVDYSGCSGEVTYAQAVALAELYGARLPTEQEVKEGAVASTGCGYNAVPVWTQTQGSAPGERIAVQGSGAGASQSDSESATHPVRYIYDNTPLTTKNIISSTVDFTVYGGSTVVMVDDGTGADAVADDNIWTAQYTATSGHSGSPENISITVENSIGISTLNEDVSPPVITLVNPIMYLIIGDPYIESGFSATDNVDGDLTASVVVNLGDPVDIDTSVAGTHTIAYSVSDTAGNSSSATRTIYVLPYSFPPIVTAANILATQSANPATDGDVITLTWDSVTDGNALLRSSFGDPMDSGASADLSSVHTGVSASGTSNFQIAAQPDGVACSGLVTYAAALALVQNKGARLPTIGEVVSRLNIDFHQDGGAAACGGNVLIWTQNLGTGAGERYAIDADGDLTSVISQAETATANVIYVYDDNPVSTLNISSATADFSAFGGGSSVAMIDDGTSGDEIASDGVFTAQYTIASGHPSTFTGNASVSATNFYATILATDDDDIILKDITVPEITSGAAGTDLEENSGAGQTVYTTVATDNVGVTSYTLAGTDAGLLAISASGVVTLTVNPDFETKSNYSFEVIVADAAGNIAIQAVTFSITNVDDEVLAPTLAITNDNGSSNSDGITNDATLTISGLEIGASYEFSRDGGNNWIPIDVAAANVENFNGALTSPGILDDSPTVTATTISTAPSLDPYSGDVPDTFFLDITTPTGSTDKEVLFESGGDGVGITVFVEGTDLKISIGGDNNASDLTASGVLAGGTRYAIIVELASGNTVNFYVAEMLGSDLPAAFGAAIASQPNAWSSNTWCGQNNTGWGRVGGGNAQGVSVNTYSSFSGTFHEGRFYSAKGFSDVWTDGTDPLTSFSGTIIARQTDTANNTSENSNEIEITFETTAPTIDTVSIASEINEGSTTLGSLSADEEVTWSVSLAGISVNVDGVLTLDTPADYESASSYTFTITATDIAGNQSNTGDITVSVNETIEITDAQTINTNIDGGVEITDTGSLTVVDGADINGDVTITDGGSLIITDSGNVNGTVTYVRSISTTNWYLISSPVTGQDIDEFVANSNLATGTDDNIGFSDYENATGIWTYYQSGATGTGNFVLGKGHAVKLDATGSVRFTGSFNNGDASIAVSSGAANNFNLIGNPYLANVSVSEMVTANTALLEEQTVWLWDQEQESYVQKNLAENLEVAPGQGFFVLTNAAGNFSITEAMQSHTAGDTFKSSDNRPEINLVMTNGADVMDANIYYIDGTTTSFDNGYDSSIFGGVPNEFAIYTQAVANSTGRNLGIQSLPNNDFENMIIPVGINATSGTEIIISATSANLPTGIHVYLEDKDDNSFTLLDDSSTFQTTFTNTSNGVGRFFIHTKTQPLSTDQADLNNVSIYLSDDNYLRIVGVQQGDTRVHIYSILGKQVVSTSFEGTGVNDILLPNLSMGIYMVQLKTKNGKLNKKIIIQQ